MISFEEHASYKNKDGSNTTASVFGSVETKGHKRVGPIRKGQGKYISDGRVCSKIVAPSER